jgi:hypothetical protein
LPAFLDVDRLRGFDVKLFRLAFPAFLDVDRLRDFDAEFFRLALPAFRDVDRLRAFLDVDRLRVFDAKLFRLAVPAFLDVDRLRDFLDVDRFRAFLDVERLRLQISEEAVVEFPVADRGLPPSADESALERRPRLLDVPLCVDARRDLPVVLPDADAALEPCRLFDLFVFCFLDDFFLALLLADLAESTTATETLSIYSV